MEGGPETQDRPKQLRRWRVQMKVKRTGQGENRPGHPHKSEPTHMERIRRDTQQRAMEEVRGEQRERKPVNNRD